MNAARLINQTSCDVEYYTPPKIIEAARKTMGQINLDPASSILANDRVKSNLIFTKSDDGLIQAWFGCVWLNHPFGRGQNKLWIDKLVTEYLAGRVKQACCITYACTSELWFRPLLKQPQCFLVPRTNYYLPDGSIKRGVTKGSVVTYFGPNATTFAARFKLLGEVKFSYDNNFK